MGICRYIHIGKLAKQPEIVSLNVRTVMKAILIMQIGLDEDVSKGHTMTDKGIECYVLH